MGDCGGQEGFVGGLNKIKHDFKNITDSQFIIFGGFSLKKSKKCKMEKKAKTLVRSFRDTFYQHVIICPKSNPLEKLWYHHFDRSFDFEPQ